MPTPKTLRAAAITFGALLAGAGTATGSEQTSPWIDPDSFDCKPIEPENLIEPPPDLALSTGETPRETRAIRAYQEDSKLHAPVCPKGEVPYPEKLTGTPRKQSPPVLSPETSERPARTASLEESRTSEAARRRVDWAGYRWVSARFPENSQGGSVEINVADPDIENGTVSHSIGQLTFTGDSGIGDGYDYSVEMGWRSAVSTGENPALFTLVNKDSYESWGEPNGDCYNCHFVPVPGADYVPGQILPSSPPPLNKNTMKFGLRVVDGNWWVWVNDQWIGYLDGDFWPNGFEYSNRHSYYGEVYDDGTGKTDMGNGYWGNSPDGASMRNPKASYYKNGQWHDVNERVTIPWQRYTGALDASHPNLYNAANPGVTGTEWKFGGPGTG